MSQPTLTTAISTLRRQAIRRALVLTAVATGLSACGAMPWQGDDSSSRAESSSPTGIQTPITATRRPESESVAPAPARQPEPMAAPSASGGTGQVLRLNPNAPDRYVVERGDTLWDISGVFLQDPWFWPEIWQVNPQVANPHLIYPGDVLNLVYIDGQPFIQLERGTATRLSPRVRVEGLEDAIPTIPFEALRAFLARPAVLGKDQVDQLPYVLDNKGGKLIAAAGNTVYTRGNPADQPGEVYNVVHVGDPLRDPDDNDVLGYEGVFVGQGRLTRSGDPASVFLLETEREALEGDRLLPEENLANVNYFPASPSSQVEGRIISVTDGVSLIGQYQVVAINRGSRHGLEPGNVLRVWQTGEVVRDRVGKGGFFGDKVRLPDEPAGTMMVFRIFDRMSYGLVLEATSEIRVLDAVRNP